MAHTTIFTCDHCKETAVDDQCFLKEVRVQFASVYGYRGDGFTSLNVPPAAWCKKCLVKFGLLHVGNTNLPAEAAPAVPATLEEVLRAIVREEIEAATGGNR